MNFLAPLFLLGALTVALPFIFHLVRRTPRGRLAFSSLLFLRASRPRVQRRSRVEDKVLLVLRIGVVCLLALAFARPFIAVDSEASTEPAGRHVAILVDTSASMRRAGLWDQALAEVRATFSAARPGDQVALFAFDEEVREVFGFGGGGVLPASVSSGAGRDWMAQQEPTWASTDLGLALVSVADRLDAATDPSRTPDVAESPVARDAEVVLITDLQRGSRLGALDRYTWPQHVRLTVRRTIPASPGNAGLASGADLSQPDGSDAFRVQVSHEADGPDVAFSVHWQDSKGDTRSEGAADLAVPAGASRVISVPRPSNSTHPVSGLVLTGDEHPFDNQLHIAPLRTEEISILCLDAEEAGDPEGARYYIERALAGKPRRTVRIVSPKAGESLIASGAAQPNLMVGAPGTDPERIREMRAFLVDGGAMICIPGEGGDAEALRSLLGLAQLEVEEAAPADFALLAEIDFMHPLFAPFDEPRYNDFTTIRFWRYRRLRGLPEDGDGVRVLARFDDGSPYLVERSVGKGRALVLTSGWHPRDSRLALSTKFVPLLEGMLEVLIGRESVRSAYLVNQRIPLPEGTSRIYRPDGQAVATVAGQAYYDVTDMPGIYSYDVDGERHGFAVNLDPAETRTAPLSVDELGQRGVLLSTDSVTPVSIGLQMRVETEASQQLWKWLLLAALVLCLLETWAAGRKAHVAAATPAGEGSA